MSKFIGGGEKITWEVKAPVHLNPQQSRDWLIPWLKLRGYALYENGLRPFFKVGPDQFLDADEFDLSSYHLLAKVNNEIVGGGRLLPLTIDLNCVTSQIMGKKNLHTILFNSFKGKIPEKLAEGSRWVVHPNYTHLFIGANIIYGIWALSIHLGYSFIANSGRHAQDFIMHFGGVYISDTTNPYHSEKYNDDISIIYFDKNKLSNRAVRSIKAMRHTLRFTEEVATPA